MKKSRSLPFIFRLTCFFCLICSLAAAQATRTWVSGVGDDANPCSRTAPCKTFAGAISKTATGGEIDVLDPGGFGAVTITKSISIEAVGVVAGVLVSGTNGIVVNAGSTDVVVLRGLTVEGLGTGLSGIALISAGTLHVENCTINHFNKGIDIAATASTQISVKDTIVRNNAGGGIHFHPSGVGAGGTLDNVRMEDNLFGLRAEDRANVTVRNSIAGGNATDGFAAFSSGAPALITVENSLSVNNGDGSDPNAAGVRASGASGRVNISNMTLGNDFPNALSEQSGGIIVSFGNNQILGNGAPTVTIGRQ